MEYHRTAMDDIVITSSLIVFFVSALLVFYIQFHARRLRLYELAGKFDGPPTLPFIGNALSLCIPRTKMIDAILQATRKYKSPVRMWFGYHLAICVWSPQDIEIVLNSPEALGKDPLLYNILEPLVGLGLATLPVNSWKRHRKLMLPSFYRRNIEKYLNIFRDRAGSLVENLQIKLDKGPFDVYYDLTFCSLQTILETSLGIDDGKNKSQHFKITEWVHCMLANFALKVTNILYHSEIIFNISKTGKQFKEAKQKYHNYIGSMMEFYLGEFEKHSAKTEDANEIAPSKPTTILEYLLFLADEADGTFTNEELRGEVQTILVAGTETNSSVIGFTLMILGIHQEVQEKLHQEITEVLGCNGEITCPALKNLKYMERVIKETMRIFPVVVGIARESDTEIQLSNHLIPAKTTIFINTISLHRDPNIWQDPTKFDPDRFLPEEALKRHPYSYIPFSAGPRNCIGTEYAWMLMKIILINIIRNYRISTCYKSIEEIQITMNLVLSPTNGHQISITKRV